MLSGKENVAKTALKAKTPERRRSCSMRLHWTKP